MWADNETEVDLLGFDFLVDTLFVALTEPRLLPLTVGLLGDWGSGKSSLMRITRQELLKIREDDESPSSYLCVEFSPWQYEDYDDVKVALMTTVLDAVGARADGDQQDQVSRLRRFTQSLGRWGRRSGRVAVSTAQAAAPLAMQAMDPSIDQQVLDVMKVGLSATATEATKLLEGPKAKPDSSGSNAADPIADAGRFRAEFEKLVKTLDDVDAVVVFIDDLDRCLPETVVDTFEAIRLFLNTPKTAYVLAANQAVVESAIDSRYPQLRRPDGAGIGADYLEKMLQLKVAIPPLSAPEADTYVNLLLAELRLDDEQFTTVLDETGRRRTASHLPMAFNLGVADTVLADVAAIRIRDGIEAVLTRELSLLGLDAVFEDSFAAIVLRISSTMQTGTAARNGMRNTGLGCAAAPGGLLEDACSKVSMRCSGTKTGSLTTGQLMPPRGLGRNDCRERRPATRDLRQPPRFGL